MYCYTRTSVRLRCVKYLNMYLSYNIICFAWIFVRNSNKIFYKKNSWKSVNERTHISNSESILSPYKLIGNLEWHFICKNAMFVQKTVRKNRYTFRHFIPVNTMFNQFLSKRSSVYTGSHYSKFPLKKNMTVYSRKAVWRRNFLTTSKSQN